MPTRRSLLRTALVGGAAVPTAGCAGGFVAPEDRPRLLRRWVPRPSTVQPERHAKLFYLDWTAVAGVSQALAEGTYRKYRNYARFLGVGDLGVPPASVSELVQVYPPDSSPLRAAVARVDHDLDQLRGRLADRYGRRAARHGVAVFWNDGEREAGSAGGGNDAGGADPPLAWGDTPVAVGVDGRHLLVGAPTPTRSGRAVVGQFAAARAGGTTRYVESSAELRAVLEALGGGDDVSAETYDPVAPAEAAPEHARFAGAAATGHRYRLRDRTTRSRYAFAFAGDAASGTPVDSPSASDVATDDATSAAGATTTPGGAAVEAAAAAVPAVRRWVDAHRDDRLFGAYGSVTVARRGRTVVVDGTLPTGEV